MHYLAAFLSFCLMAVVDPDIPLRAFLSGELGGGITTRIIVLIGWLGAVSLIGVSAHRLASRYLPATLGLGRLKGEAEARQIANAMGAHYPSGLLNESALAAGRAHARAVRLVWALLLTLALGSFFQITVGFGLPERFEFRAVGRSAWVLRCLMGWWAPSLVAVGVASLLSMSQREKFHKCV